jgi:hypothetical protein
MDVYFIFCDLLKLLFRHSGKKEIKHENRKQKAMKTIKGKSEGKHFQTELQVGL